MSSRSEAVGLVYSSGVSHIIVCLSHCRQCPWVPPYTYQCVSFSLLSPGRCQGLKVVLKVLLNVFGADGAQSCALSNQFSKEFALPLGHHPHLLRVLAHFTDDPTSLPGWPVFLPGRTAVLVLPQMYCDLDVAIQQLREKHLGALDVERLAIHVLVQLFDVLQVPHTTCCSLILHILC